MSEPPAYDSRADILAHIHHVRDRLSQFATELLQRGAAHDASKLTQAEKPAFDLVTPLLPNIAYGSPEYRALEDRVQPALLHHYQHNSHHPQHYGDRGVAGMDLFDIVEMICDWIASAARRPEDGVKLDHNVKLFAIEPQLANILANTLERWPKPGSAS